MDPEDSFIQTYTLKKFWPLMPERSEICIEDIAHSLSNMCRFTGHSNFFYSVAEHCCLMSDVIIEDKYKLEALMHDAAEAYLIDIPKPIKDFLFVDLGGEKISIKDIEDKILARIIKHFDLEFPLSDFIKLMDSRMLATERWQVFSSVTYDWPGVNFDSLPVRIQFWDPKRAEKEFLDRFDGLYTKEIK